MSLHLTADATTGQGILATARFQGRIRNYSERNEDMEEYVYVSGECLYIALPKEVDQYQTEMIRCRADKLLKDESVDRVVFDFAQTEFMDSSGIGLIVGRYERTVCFGGKVWIVNASERIKKVLTMSGLGCLIRPAEQAAREDDRRKMCRSVRMDKGVCEL